MEWSPSRIEKCRNSELIHARKLIYFVNILICKFIHSFHFFLLYYQFQFILAQFLTFVVIFYLDICKALKLVKCLLNYYNYYYIITILAGLTLNCFRRACYFQSVTHGIILRILRTQKVVSFLSRNGCTLRVVQRYYFKDCCADTRSAPKSRKSCVRA